MLDLNNVYNGDCIEVMKSIDDKSIDLILCDLPYGITNCSWDSVIPMDALWKQYKRIIAPKGAIILTATMPFGAKLIMSNERWFRHEVIWEKDNGTNPFLANKQLFRVHENVLVFSRNSFIYNPQMTIGKAYSTNPKASLFRVTSTLRKIPTINNGTRYPKSIQKFSSQRGLHPTQKPVKLFEWLIKTYSHEGMTVLDNCAGSGTTAIACLNTKRNFILIERDERYYNECKERIEKYDPNAPVKPKRSVAKKHPQGQLSIFNIVKKLCYDETKNIGDVYGNLSN